MNQSDNKKNGWVSPNVQKFGGQKGAAKTAAAMFGAECGESVIRYGPTCGIRTGSNCKSRTSANCSTLQFGVSCIDRQASPCTSMNDNGEVESK